MLCRKEEAGRVTFRPEDALLEKLVPNAARHSLQMSWVSNGVTKTASASANGTITGDATGTAIYLNGLVVMSPKVEARWSDIRSRLRDSAKTGSRIDSARANFHTPSSVTQSMPLAQVFPDASLAHTQRTSEAVVLAEGGQ